MVGVQTRELGYQKMETPLVEPLEGSGGPFTDIATSIARDFERSKERIK